MSEYYRDREDQTSGGITYTSDAVTYTSDAASGNSGGGNNIGGTIAMVSGTIASDNGMATYQQNARDNNPKKEIWYAGEKPTTQEIYKRIGDIYTKNPERGKKLAQDYLTLQRDPKSQFYNPYAQATNPAVRVLQSLGVDMNKVTDDYLDNNIKWKQYLRFGDSTTTPKAPTKKSSTDEVIAYHLYQYAKQRDLTRKADTEMEAMRQQIAYLVGRTDLNLSDAQIAEKINQDLQKKYPTLYQMEHSTEAGKTILELNHAIDYSSDNLMGMIWAARNGNGSGNAFLDNVNGAMGAGNIWQDNPDIYAKLDRGNAKTFSPYEVGMTANDIGMYFNVNVLDEKTLEDIRKRINWDDPTDVSMFDQAVSVVETTKTAKDENTKLREKIDKCIQDNWSVEDVLRQLDRMMDSNDYSTLRKMDKSIKTGTDIVLTGEAINFNLEALKQEIRERCEYQRQHTGVLGIWNNISSAVGQAWNDLTSASAAAVANLEKADAQAAATADHELGSEYDVRGEAAAMMDEAVVAGLIEEPKTKEEQVEAMRAVYDDKYGPGSYDRDIETARENSKPYDLRNIDDGSRKDFKNNPALDAVTPNYEGTNAGSGQAPVQKKTVPLLTDEELIAEKKSIRDMSQVAPTITNKGTPAEKAALTTGNTSFYEASVINLRNNIGAIATNLTGQAEQKVMTDFYNGYMVTNDYDNHKFRADYWQEQLDNINAELDSLNAKDPIDFDEYENLVALSERTGDSTWDYFRTRLERGEKGLDQYQQEEYDNALRYVYQNVRPTDYTTDEETIRNKATGWWNLIQGGLVKDLNYRTEADLSRMEELTNDKEILENGINEEREYLSAHQDAYDKALKDVSYARNLYMEAVSIAQSSGKEIDADLISKIEDICLYINQDNFREPTATNPYDSAVASGMNTKAESTIQALTDAVNAESQIEDITSTMEYLQKMGISFTDEQKQNLDDKIAALREQGMIASWSALDSNPDFEAVAAEGYKEAKTSNSPIALMVAADSAEEFRKSVFEYASRTGDYSVDKLTPGWASPVPGSNADSGLRPLEMSWPDQYEYAAAMSPEEKNRFFYLMKKDGIEEAEKYFKTLLADDTGMVTLRKYGATRQENREFASENLLTAALSTFASFETKLRILPAELMYGNQTFRDQTEDYRAGSAEAIVNAFGAKDTPFGEVLKKIYNIGVGIADYRISAAMMDSFMGLAGQIFGGTAAAGFMSKIGGVVGETGTKLAKSAMEVLPIVAEDASAKYNSVYKQTRDKNKAAQMAALEMVSGLVSHSIICQGLHTSYNANPTSVVEGFTGLVNRIITTSGVIGGATIATSEVEQIVEKAIMGADSTWAKTVQTYKNAGYSKTMAEQMADQAMQRMILSKTLDAVGNAALRTTLTYSVGAIKNSKTFQDGKLKMANAWRDIKDYTKAFVKGSQGTIGGEPDFILDENGNVIGRQQEKLTGNVPDGSRVVPTSGTKVMDRVHGKSYNVVGYTYNEADGEVVFITEDNERVRFTDLVGKDGNVTKESFTESELNLMQNAYNWYQNNIVNAPDTAGTTAPEPEPEPIRPDPQQESTDLSIINATYGADATAAAIGISSVLGDVDPNVSRAAGQSIVADLANGDPKTAALAMQEIVMNTVNPANVKPDIVTAALVTGEGQKALRKIMDKVSRGKHVAKGDIMTLITGVAKDRKNPDHKDQMAAAVRSNRIANKTNKKLTEKKDIIYEADKKVTAAQERVATNKESLESAENEVQAAFENVTTAVNDLLNDPGNNDNRGPVQRALAHLDGKDDQTIKQAEQAVTNAEQELAKAQEERDQKEDDVLAESREESIIETDQEIQAENQIAADNAANKADQEAQAKALSDQKEAEALAKRTERETAARNYLADRGYSGDELEENVGIIMKRFDAIENGEVDTNERLTAEDADEFLNVISRRTGITFQTEDLGDPLMNRGYIVNRNNVVLNSNLDKGQALIEAANHEITHGLEMTGAYNKFADVALKMMYGGTNTPAYERAIEKKIADYGSRGKPLTPEDAQYELVAEFSRHNLANKQFINKIVASGIGGQYKKFVAASYEKLKGYKFKGAGRRQVNQLKKAERLLQEAIDERARMVKEGYNGHTGLVQLSISGVTDAVGLSLEVTDNDTAMYKLYKDGQEIKPGEFTPEMVADTKIGKILDLSLNNKKKELGERVKNGSLSKEDYDKQIASAEKAVQDEQKFLADIVNMIGKYQDAAMVWELAGSLAFTTLKENGDPQYTDSDDMGSICTKTQAILNVISETQLRLGRGLTKEEIDGTVYEEVGKGVIGPDGKWKHGATPCPPCYVYATWVNKPARLEKARQLREEFKDWTDEQINDLMTAPDPVGRTKTETKAMKTEQNQRKLFLECCIAEKKGDTWVKRENPELCPNEVLLDLRRSGDMAVNYPGTWLFMQKGGNALGKAIVPYSDSRVGEYITAKAMGAGAAYKKLLEDARNAGNPDYVPKFLNPFVYKDYLDQQLQSGKLTEKKYKEKLQKNEELAKEYFEKAVDLTKIQNLMGGQRWQSWSDFRAEWGSDYLMEMLNMQVLGAQVQTYTKVPEALDLFATAGFEVNMSLMPHGDGFWHNEDGSIMLDEDGNPKLRFSKTTGIDPEAAELYAKKYGAQGNVQPMVVGISDDHIKAALASDYIGFVIPFHGSGGSVKRLQHLMSLLKEHMETGSDYTMAQTDSFVDYVEVGSGKNKKKVNTNPNWQLRLAIMTNKYDSLSDEDKDAIDNNEFLSKLYEDRYVNEDSQAYHVFFSEDQAQQIYPYEYWDTNTTLATADENSKRFIEYCKLLGVVPRFSGLTKKAERGKFFTPEEVGNHKVIARDKNGNAIEYEYANFSGATYDEDGNIVGYDPVKGYWKLLIDRSMYNRIYDEKTGKIIKEKSTYHDPKPVNVSGVKVQAMPKAANNTTGQSEEETDEITDRVVTRLAADSIMNMTLGNTPIENEEENAAVTKKVMYADSDEVQELSGGQLSDEEATRVAEFLTKQYDQAVASGDLDVAEACLDLAAEAGGYSLEKAYHGTDEFGFTEFDMEKSQGVIFVSFSKDQAGTYTSAGRVVHEIGVPLLSKLTNMSRQEMAEEIERLYPGAAFNEVVPIDMDEAIKRASDEIRKVRDTLGELDPEINEAFDDLIEYNIGFTPEEIIERYDKINSALQDNTKYDAFELFDAAELLADAIGGKDIYALVADHSTVYKTRDQIIEEETHYSKDAEDYKHGIYQLYTRPKNQLVIDANGERWKHLTFDMLEEATNGDAANWKEYTNNTLVTRQVAEIARNHGYDSVRINNLQDHGGISGRRENGFGDIAIFFNPQDVKSADPVTYDANGEVVPISERFSENADIRWSSGGDMTDSEADEVVRQMDENYLAAVNSGDMETAQQMVDESAKEAGYNLATFHGTGEYFTTFNRGYEGIHLGNEAQANQVAKARYKYRSKETEYKWGDIKDRVGEMSLEQRESLAKDAYLEQDYFSDGISVGPFDGDLNDADAVREYADSIYKRHSEATKDNIIFSHEADDTEVRMLTFDRKTGENVMSLYAKINNPFVIDADILEWSPRRIAISILNMSNGTNTILKPNGVETKLSGSEIHLTDLERDVLEAIKMNQTTGDEAWDVIADVLGLHDFDGIKYLNQYEGDRKSYSYLALRPSDVKSADPVTYDDNGEIIPPSKRFNDQNNDIRWSEGGELTEADLDKALEGMVGDLDFDDFMYLLDHGHLPEKKKEEEIVPPEPEQEPEPIDWNKANEDYMAAVESGDISTAGRLVDEKARELGYTVYGTHRTNAEFTVFEKNDESGKRGSTLGNGFYVANGIGTEYDNDHYGKRRLLIYANPGKTLDTQKGGLTKRQANKVFDQYFAPFHPGAADHDNPYYRHVIMQLQNGHRVVDYIKEAAENAGTTTDEIFKQLGYNSLKDGPQYCLFDSEQIKLADPITYDDAGNPIPLSERFTSSRYARPNGEMENALYVKNGNLADGNTVDFVGEMLNENGRKKYETRKYGNIKPGWYGLTRGGKGASVEGRVEFGEPIPFRKYEDDGVTPTQIYQDSMIEGTEYDMGPEDTKYAYPVLNREDFRDNPIPVYRNSPRYAKYSPPSEEAERFKDIRYSGNGRLTDAEADMVLVESGLISPEMIPYSYTPSNFVIDGKKKYRQFGREKAQQSNAIHDQVKDYLYNNSEYDPDTNAEQIDRAITWIREKATDNDPDGYYAALKEVLDPNFNYATADGTVRMLAVAGMATIKAEAGDPRALQDEQDIYNAFNERATPLAQAMQARKLFQIMTPIGRRQAIMSEEDRINNDLEKRGKKYRVHIPRELVDEVVNARDAKSFRKGKKKIRDILNQQIPVTWGERIIAIRMWSMLSSPKTHLRNIFGNVMMIPTVGTKNKIGAVIELVSLDKSQRTKALGFANKDAKTFAKNRVKEIEDVLRGNAKFKEGDKRRQERKIFGTKNDPISKTLGKGFQWLMDKYPGQALEIEDWWFLMYHYENAMAGLMTARGLKPEDMKGNVLEEAEEYAIKEAWKATYRDESGVADWLNRIGSKKTNAENNKVLSVIQWVVNTRFPFKRTPINIAKRGIEYSPVGLVKSLSYDAFLLHQYNEAKKNGKQPPVSAISPSEWIDRFSSGLTGTGILIAGAIAGLFGLSRAGFSKNDPEDQIAKMKGEQEYSIHPARALSTMIEGIGKKFDPDFEFELAGEDVSMTLDWAAPRVLPFFTGTALVEYYKEHGLSVGGILDLLMEVTEPMMNMSFMSGVADIFKTDSFSDKPGFWQFIEKTAINFATSLIPTWVGQIVSTANGRKTTYKNPESVTGDPDLDKAIQQIGNKIGWVGIGGVPYTNTLGEEPENVLPSWFENIFSPAYFSKVDESEEMKELTDLYLSDPESNKKIVPGNLDRYVKIGGKNVYLNGEQYTKLKADRGTAWRDTVKKLVNSPLYKSASDDSKAEMLNIADSYATSIAKHMYDSNYKLDGWMESAYRNGNAAEAIIDRVADQNKKYYVESQARSFAEALYTNNRGDIKKYAQELQEHHADASTVRRQLTEYFKPLYKKAYDSKDGPTMRNIEFLLTDLDFYLTLDKPMTKYTDKTFEGWTNSKFDEDEDSTDHSWLK